MSDFVSALFDTRERCDHAVELLTQEGFDFSEIQFTQGALAGPVVGAPIAGPGAPGEGEPPSEPPPPGPAPDTPEPESPDGVALGAAAGAAFGLSLGRSKAADSRLRDGGFIVGVRASGDRRNVALEALTRAGGESFDVT